MLKEIAVNKDSSKNDNVIKKIIFGTREFTGKLKKHLDYDFEKENSKRRFKTIEEFVMLR